ncbi:plastid division protein CDP1, chloroplastic-like isoform X2 [Primulina tabacum]|uniref:plastid division protein CDP1, chloroplastic-like isoform X2 n=1 Tax=Primulina tabacum TaxID=48773 RepID=UPI003F5A731F
MANIHALVTSVNDICCCGQNSGRFHWNGSFVSLNRRKGYRTKNKCGNSGYRNGGRVRVPAVGGHPWRLRAATDPRFVEESTSRNSIVKNQVPFIEIPVTCYQILGLHDQAEKDEIAKSVIHLTNTEIDEGYTEDVVVSRPVLKDVRDKLLFEPEYAGIIKENQPPKSSLKIPWDWLPVVLCLLQEAGEEKLVLEIGRRAMQHPCSKPFIHDMLLAMALAECVIANVGFEKQNISHGFEALVHARYLLGSKSSLGKLKLLSQIEEYLEKLAPDCTLELLRMPHTPDNTERRRGAISALQELLRQGLDVETSCQVQDWPCFLNQALKELMASEIVDLIPWDNLAVTRKNRKSIESQNQRTVIDSGSFYMVMLAHIALGFSSKQVDLINKAKLICECLTSEGFDLKFEEAFCSLLLGQSDQATAAERLRQLEVNSNPSSQKSTQMKKIKEVSSADKPLETWLIEAALSLFPDTRDCSPSLADFFTWEKRTSGKRHHKRTAPAVSNIRHRPLAIALPLDRRDEEPVSSAVSSLHLGIAVKQLAPPDLQIPLTESMAIDGGSGNIPSAQLKRSLGSKQADVWKFWLSISHVLGKMIYAAALGFILVALLKLKNTLFWRAGNGARWRMDKQSADTSSLTWSADSSTDLSHQSLVTKKNGIARKFQKFLSALKVHFGYHSEAVDLKTASLFTGMSSNMSSSMTSTYGQQLSVKDAEILVKRWQAIKAEALGPNHDVHGLLEVLDGSMLVQWQNLADAAKGRSCFWRFVLLQLEVTRADILKDGVGREMAEIEVFLEEAAELVDESQPKNPTYYSPYKILYLLKRQDDGSWRFCEGDILTTSQPLIND